jgi:hypothetical protein
VPQTKKQRRVRSNIRKYAALNNQVGVLYKKLDFVLARLKADLEVDEVVWIGKDAYQFIDQFAKRGFAFKSTKIYRFILSKLSDKAVAEEKKKQEKAAKKALTVRKPATKRKS